MSALVEPGPTKKPKQLACKRCRHRKQKCTEVRPCTNCTQSGAECVPTDPAAPKPALQLDYVQRLEERVAQLESLIPQESLDHIDDVQHDERPLSASRVALQPISNEPFIETSCSPDQDYQANPTQLQSPGQYNGAYLALTPVAAETNPDVINIGLFGAISGVFSQLSPNSQDEAAMEDPNLGLELEVFLIQTYFDMAHSQYPLLLKHQFLQWAEYWSSNRDSVPASMRWKGFFIHMVFAIAFLMTKSRINGPVKSQALYTLAISKYLPYLMAHPSALIRTQGFLILTVYALHMPSRETIITLSTWTIRFCVMSELHLAETEPEPVSNEALVNIQHRRRVFWCAYAIDRAVCSSYNLPCSVSDSHITVPVFDNIDDEQLTAAISSTQRMMQLPVSTSPTSVSSALHIFFTRQIESEIQDKVLKQDFDTTSEKAFKWRAAILGKLGDWDNASKASTEPSQKGYVSFRWLKMIYFYNVVMLYRPTKAIVQGISGDLTVQACCQALILFRKFQMAREIAQPWLGLLTQFQIGVTLLYCFFATPPSQWKASYKSADVPDAIRACSSTLAILAERWAEAECIRDTFEILAREIPLGETWERPRRISQEGKAGIEANWSRMSKVVLHRPTLGMIEEIATTEFVDLVAMELDNSMNGSAATTVPEAAAALFGDIELQWADLTQGAPLEMGNRFYLPPDLDGTSQGPNFYI